MPPDTNLKTSTPLRPLIRLPARLAGVVQAAPDLAIAGVFLVTWMQPDQFGETAVRHLVLVMLLEFLVIHSAGFMGAAALAAVSAPKRLLAIVGLGLFYSLFTGAFSLGFKTAWPFVSFWILTANRMLAVVVSPVSDLRETNVVMGGWALNVVAYLGCCFLTVLVPMPRFGITAAVVGRQDLGAGGLWQNSPHTAIAFGFFYFSVVGLAELFLVGRLTAPKQATEQP